MTILNKKTNYLILILILTSSISFADNILNNEFWSSIALEYKPDKKWTIGLEGELRLRDKSNIDQYFSHLSIDYKIKNVKLGFGIRYIKNNDLKGKIQGYENHLRFNFDLSLKHKLGPILFKHRLRYQNKNELGISSSEGDYPNQHFRFKTNMTYKIKNWKLDPIFSAEIFNHFEKGEKTQFDKYRLTFGTNYNIKKFGKIGLFYRFEKTLNSVIQKSTNILMFKYTYVIK